MSQLTNLRTYNTFGVDAHCTDYHAIHDVDSLQRILRDSDSSFVLGGGSNMLLTKDVDVPVLHMLIMGIEVVSTGNDHTIVKVGAGENWHNFVLWAIDNNLGGIENLSLIPGTVGAAPIQNIGAYGVELQDVFYGLEAVHIQSRELRGLNKGDCNFGYRSSIFKNSAKGKYVITSVSFHLTNKDHKLALNYGAIKKSLDEKGVDNPSIKDVSDTVIAIRNSKLPDPAELGNSGSFFKNPVVAKKQLDMILAEYPDVKHFPFGNSYKIPAAWLIEQCGWKGKRSGNCGVSEKHALVLVNYGNATGQEILKLSHQIQSSVKEKFGIDLQPEVNIF